MRSYLLRINGHYYTWVDSPHGADVAAVSAAHDYARFNRVLGHDAKILVEVMDYSKGGIGSFNEKVLEAFRFVVEVKVVRVGDE